MVAVGDICAIKTCLKFTGQGFLLEPRELISKQVINDHMNVL